MRSPASRWLRQLVVANGAPIVCAIPAAGAGSTVFRPWIAEAPGGLEIIAVSAPGREERFSEEPIRTIEPLADQIAAALEHYADRPLAILGHSLGALVGREVARRLGKGRVRLLVVAGARPPNDPSPGEYASADDGELIRLLQEWGGTPPAVLASPDFASTFLPCLRADLDAYASCRTPPSELQRLDVPILALAGRHDPFAPPIACGGWTAWTSAGFDLEILPGGHAFPITEARAVLRTTARHFARATEAHRSLAPRPAL